MADKWRFFPCSMGDDQAFIFVNVALAKSIADAPQFLVKLRLAYKSPRPNGLPTSDEFEAVKAVEEQIEAFADKARDCYVGRITVAGHRHFYIYTMNGEAAWIDLASKLSVQSGYEIRVHFRDDPAHKAYQEELYPTEDDWQVIKDLEVIEQLEKHGDDGSEQRKVDHWIYFDDKASSVDFLRWAESNRFTEDCKYCHATEDGKYCVRLFHHGTIKIGDISSHTISLRRKAAKYGGTYDGWEAPIMASSVHKIVPSPEQ